MSLDRDARLEWIESFLKNAQEEAQKPFGASDAKKITNRMVPRGPQTYAQPSGATATTRPDTVQSQKALPPPPVL